MILKNYTDFIKEGYDSHSFRNDMLKKLKKKLGAKNVNDMIYYRDSDRPRSPMKTNWNMFDSMYIEVAEEDYSMINDENWEYIWRNISSHRITHDEKGKKFIEHMINTYKPSYEMIAQLFSRSASYNPNPVTEYLIPMLNEKDLRNMISDTLPYGLGYSSDKSSKCVLFYKLGMFKFEGEPGPDDNLVYGKISQSMLPKFLGFKTLENIAREAMSKNGFKWNNSFFEAIIKHPNDGGINSSNTRFKREIEILSELKSFRNYIIANPSLIELEVGWKEEGRGKNTLFDFLPEYIQNDERIKNYVKSKGGIDKFKL